MSLRITNIAALGAQRQLSKATRALKGNYQRLSSGLRINSAKDDPAGLCICDRMTSQINGLTQGNRNANDGISLCQIADGAMEEMTEIVQRMRTLAVQSANGTNSSSERQAIQDEVNELCAQLEYISSSRSRSILEMSATPSCWQTQPVPAIRFQPQAIRSVPPMR